MSRLSISLLGAFQVTLDSEPVTDFATDKARALLAYLVVEADYPHRRDALAGLLWPDEPQRKARHNLRQALSYLRQAISDDDNQAPLLLVSRQTIQFNTQSDHWLDVKAFKTLAALSRNHHHRGVESCLPCIRRMERMAELYQGRFLEQFFLGDSGAFEEWATLEREWLQRKAVKILQHLTNYHERRGDYERAQEYAWLQVKLEPWREEAHRQLMRLLALDGKRSMALAQYEVCCQSLGEELGVEPMEETKSLYEQISSSKSQRALAELQICKPTNLPLPTTPFVGRETDLVELAELLANPDCRMVTLIGPGGIGKTRLALQAATDHIGTFTHGIIFVPLAPVISSSLLAPTIADALDFPFQEGLTPEGQLLSYLREKEILLVLDGLEHILEGSALLTRILQQAPRLTILVTSRERLNVQEEWIYEVKGLTYPQKESAKDGTSYSAITLFQQCALRMIQRSSFDEAELVSITRICQLVEGIPLGIELAAAWLRVHSCKEIALEVERNLDILTTHLRNVPKRHRSIRAAFEHSWELLSEAEKELFAQLSVFRGGFQRESAAAVTGATPSMLSALLDKSLIHSVSSARYDMHKVLKQYAEEKLKADQDAYLETQSRHSHYFTAFLEGQEERLKGAGQKQALIELSLEIENARQAWLLAITQGHASEIERSVESLYCFFESQGRFQEGVKLFGQAIERWNSEEQLESVTSKVRARQGALHLPLGRYQETRACLEESLEVSERLGMESERVFCLITLADLARKQSQYERTEQLAQKSLALSRQIGDHRGEASSLFLLGVARYRIGHVDRAEALLNESLGAARASGDQRLIMSALNTLGDVTSHRGEYNEAQALFEECVKLSRELEDPYSTAVHLNNLGTVLHVVGEHAQAQQYYQESLEICQKIGDWNGQAIALSNLGEVAHALGTPYEALTYCQKALSIGREIEDQWTILACLNNLGEITCTLNDYTRARVYFAEGLKLAKQTQTVPVLLKILVNLAILLAKQGKGKQAAEILEIARQHPASEQSTQERAERLLHEMELASPGLAPGCIKAIVAKALKEISVSERGQ